MGSGGDKLARQDMFPTRVAGVADGAAGRLAADRHRLVARRPRPSGRGSCSRSSPRSATRTRRSRPARRAVRLASGAAPRREPLRPRGAARVRRRLQRRHPSRERDACRPRRRAARGRRCSASPRRPAARRPATDALARPARRVLFRADAAAARPARRCARRSPSRPDELTNLVQARATVATLEPVSVAFAVKRGSGRWSRIAADDSPPYRGFLDPRAVPPRGARRTSWRSRAGRTARRPSRRVVDRRAAAALTRPRSAYHPRAMAAAVDDPGARPDATGRRLELPSRGLLGNGSLLVTLSARGEVERMLWPHVDGPDNVGALRLGVRVGGTASAGSTSPRRRGRQAWDGDASVLRTTVAADGSRSAEIVDVVDPDEPRPRPPGRDGAGDARRLGRAAARGGRPRHGRIRRPCDAASSCSTVAVPRSRSASTAPGGARGRPLASGAWATTLPTSRRSGPARVGARRRRARRRRARRDAVRGARARTAPRSGTPARRRAARRGRTRGDSPGRPSARGGSDARPAPAPLGARARAARPTGRRAGSSRRPRWTRASPSPAATGSSGRATSPTSCSACSRPGAATLRRPPFAGSPATQAPEGSGCTATGRPASRRRRGGSIRSTRPASRWSRPRRRSASSRTRTLDRELWPVVRRAADFLVSFLDPATGLPRASTDLWEQHDGQHAYSAAVDRRRAARRRPRRRRRHEPALARRLRRCGIARWRPRSTPASGTRRSAGTGGA